MRVNVTSVPIKTYELGKESGERQKIAGRGSFVRAHRFAYMAEPIQEPSIDKPYLIPTSPTEVSEDPQSKAIPSWSE
jgi:hypothetical protein